MPFSDWTDRYVSPIIVITRKYQLCEYILALGAPGTPGSPLRHMEQLLLVTSCDSPAGIGASLRTDARTDARTDGQTDVTLQIVF